MGFYCIAYQVSHKRSYQSSCSYIRDVSIRNTSRRFKMFLNHSRQLLFEECRSMLVILYYWFLYMGFSVLSTRCHTKSPTNLLVLIFGFQCIVFQVSRKRSYQSTGSYIWLLVYCLPGVTQKVLPICSYIRDFSFRSTSRRFGMFHNQNSQSLFGECRSMPGILIYWFLYIGFSVLSTRCHTKGSSNLQVLIYGIFILGIHQEEVECFVLVYCVPGVTQKVLPIYRFLDMAFSVLSTVCHIKGPTNLFLYTGFFFQEYIKNIWDVRQPQQPITIWRVQKYAGHLNLLVIYGFQCTVYLPIYRFLYICFSVLCSRCNTKSPTNLLVLIFGFQCIVLQVSRKRSYQSTGSYIWLLVYCLPGVTQKVLPIQRFLYMGFFFQEYIKNIWDVRQPQQSITIWRVQKYAGHLNLLVLIYGFQCIVYQVSHKRSYQSTGS